MNVLNTIVSLDAQNITFTEIERRDFCQLLHIQSEQLQKMFTSKYDKRNLKDISFIVFDEGTIAMAISYDYGDVIDLRNGIGMILNDEEKEIIYRLVDFNNMLVS